LSWSLALSDLDDSEKYLDIDALSNAIDYLRRAEQALRVKADPFRWKWAVLGVANGLYGLLICALHGSNWANVMDFGSMPEDKEEELSRLYQARDTDSYIKAHDIEDEYLYSRAAKLISFEDALKRARKQEHMARYTLPNSKPLELTECQVQNILRLWRTFRNRFEHFRPMNWTIEQDDFRPLLSDALVAVEQLCSNANIRIAYRHHVDELRPLAPRLRAALAESSP
jgi:hypothetical protein